MLDVTLRPIPATWVPRGCDQRCGGRVTSNAGSDGEERYSYVRLVHAPFSDPQSELVEVEAVVGGEKDVRVVQLIQKCQLGDDAPNQVVEGEEAFPPRLMVMVVVVVMVVTMVMMVMMMTMVMMVIIMVLAIVKVMVVTMVMMVVMVMRS